MPSPATSQASSIFQYLRTVKKTLQEATPEVKVAAAPDQAEFDVLEGDIFDILRLIRSWKNMVSPINKTPPEILALIPSFFDCYRDRGLITLSHVCRAWREVFISRSSLWVNFYCKDGDKTRVYLERSKSSPINLSLGRPGGISPCDPLFQVIPRATGRLRFLSVEGTPENVQVIIAHLSRPAPLLEHLKVDARCGQLLRRYLTPGFAPFNGDLSSLRTLHLEYVRTELPWRNMVNLTSLTLADTLPEEVSVGQLLDFFEGAPRLCKVTLRHVTPTAGVQNGRLVSLVCLKSMYIGGGGPPSVLLDHLVIPVGMTLTTEAELPSSLIGEHLPRSLGNLKNLSNFTTIELNLGDYYPRTKFSGPNGDVTISRTEPIDRLLESLTQLDTSKTQRLEVNRGDFTLSSYSLHQALLSMTDLRTLTLSKCKCQHDLVDALNPNMSSPKVVVCPKLEELIVTHRFCEDALYIESITGMAAARASRGKKLRTVRISNECDDDPNPEDISELKKHVWNVEYGPRSEQSAADSDEEY